MDAPEAIAITNRAVWNPPRGSIIKAEVIPAAVIIATVEEPCKTRTQTAAKKANGINPKPILEK